MQPDCEAYPSSRDLTEEPSYPLRMWLCGSCNLAQLVEDSERHAEGPAVVEPRAMAEQASLTLEMLVSNGLLRPGSSVIEIGSPHSPSWRSRLEALGLRCVEHVGARADVVLDVYGLLHESDQHVALDRRASALAEGGCLVFQLHSILSAVDQGQFGELRHGHYAYWSLPALDAALRRRGMGVHRARRFPTDGGTLVVVANRRPEPDPATLALVLAESSSGATDAGVLGGLQSEAQSGAARLRSWLLAQRDCGRVVIGYGAASRSVPLLCYARVDRSMLVGVADASPMKQGCTMPGTGVPVVPPDQMLSYRPDWVLLFLPDLLGEVRATYPDVERSGAEWVVVSDLPNREDARLVAAGREPVTSVVPVHPELDP